jgi:hypothetical protein
MHRYDYQNTELSGWLFDFVRGTPTNTLGECMGDRSFSPERLGFNCGRTIVFDRVNRFFPSLWCSPDFVDTFRA